MKGHFAREATWRLTFCALFASGCDSGEETARVQPEDGGNGAADSAGDSGQFAHSGNDGQSGGSGGNATIDADGAPASGGAGGAAGDAGTDGPPPRCNDCWLLTDSVTWDLSALFYADGERIVWQEGRDTYDPIATVNIDGSNQQSFTVTGCQVRWGNPTLYGGYVYFNNILRVPQNFGPGSSCETVYEIDTSVPAPPVAYGYFLDTIGNAFWETVYEHDVYRLVRVDLSTFRARDESNPNALRVGAADASYLYGHDNPAGGSGSYRLLRYDRVTQATTVLATYVVVPNELHVDDTFLYFESNGGLYKVPKDTTVEVEPTAVPGPDGEWRLLVDGTDVVYFKYEETAFHRMPITGGSVETFSTGAFVVRGVTWDATRYFVMLSEPNDTYGFRLVRIPK